MSYIIDVDLPRHAWDTPPFLLIASPTLPVQSVDAYIRTYVRLVNHVTTKRKEVDHIQWIWGSIQRALRVRGSPAKKIRLFLWSSHCLEDFLLILRASCLSYGSPRLTLPLHLGRCSSCKQNKRFVWILVVFSKPWLISIFFQPFFIKMTPSWHCDIQLNPK